MNARRGPLISPASPTRRPGRRRATARAVLASVAALGVLGLSACGTGKAGGDVSDGVDVVASFYPMRFLAEEVGGEHVSVTSLVKPGVEAHDLELGPQQTASLSDADLVVYLKGFQPAVDDAVEQSGPAHVAEVSSYTELREHGGHEHEEEHGHEEGHGHEEEHGHEGHDHGEGSLDPHVWLDPVKYAEMAEGVGDALAEADPDHASDYRANAEELAGKLKTLDTEFREGLENRRTDTFVTTHAAFGYLAERYGLHEESIAGLDPESGTSGARMKELHEIVEHDGVDTVFFEADASDRTARTLADDLGLRTDVLDPVEGITDASRGDDYFEVMRANLQALRKALGAE
ncbi:zinc ABC transporter substrate-binding protein [Streptomyces sp. TRM43335]|uniref:Zinc ABC transporter substrate-binding protein n=1 Tax=Streptomyces taklimakanensis TaxID=2569853 RepID=A0A6G2BA85_9ACTN|nr:metal ABC transporter substrate-binding protein [Streptomyces taklimakanensis]MTE18973.1 zinc ABC transporter substrate-binding protein [Streptomyces taklimakanensis]